MYRINQYSPPPPPRRAWLKLAILGALGVVLLVVAVSSVAAAAAFRLGARRAAAPAAPEAPAPLVAPTSVAEAAPEGDRRPADEPPLAVSAAEASLRARPTWARRREHHAGASTDPYAPQPSRPLEVFLAAEPMSGAIDRDFVICRFQSFNKADTFAGDDLHVRATFGATTEVAADGPEDGNLGFASAPLVRLSRGDVVRFEVYDRDVFGMTLLSRPSVRWEGGPFTTVDAGAAVECRQLGGAALARLARTAGARADGAVATLGRARLDAERPDWGYPEREAREAERAVADVAALTGWADPIAAARVRSLDESAAKVDAQRGAVFTRLHEGARREATFEGMDVSIGEVDCHASTCTIHLSVTNRGREPLRFGGFAGPRVYVATPTAGPIPVAVRATVEPSTTSDVRFDADVARGAALAGVCVRGRGYRDRCQPLVIR